MFGDGRSRPALTLVGAALAEAEARADLEVVALCDATPRRLSPWRARLGRLFRHSAASRPQWESLAVMAKRHRVPLLVPPERNVNHPEFVDWLRAHFKPDFGLTLGCVQIFRSALLKTFRATVNFHNGLLPAYRGLAATRWSVYCGESDTGFTFHYMNERIDDGPMLIQGALAVAGYERIEDLELEKARRAADCLPELFDAVVTGDPGRPQVGPRSYFGLRERVEIRRVDDPSALSWSELRKRLHAFGSLSLRLGGKRYEVTELQRIQGRPRRRRLAFASRDGVEIEPVRFDGLPLAKYRLLSALRRAVGG